MGFVVGYAPCGLSPQTDGMPVIHENGTRVQRMPFLIEDIRERDEKSSGMIPFSFSVFILKCCR
jgi:hypothetical protein